jgi:hypothetical protein
MGTLTYVHGNDYSTKLSDLRPAANGVDGTLTLIERSINDVARSRSNHSVEQNAEAANAIYAALAEASGKNPDAVQQQKLTKLKDRMAELGFNPESYAERKAAVAERNVEARESARQRLTTFHNPLKDNLDIPGNNI